MKRVLSIQDLSCVGRCSLTVALPVLSAMGCQAVPLPTTLLSTHTAFPAPYRRALTEDMVQIAAHWAGQQVDFDAITVGYLAGPDQVRSVQTVLEMFSGIVVVDPAMGDHGKLYSSLGPEQVEAMAHLCRRGNVLLPNVTEAALLTGLPYRAQTDDSYLRELLDGMLAFGADAVVITGVSGGNGRIGFAGRDAHTDFFRYDAPCIPRQFHGTGDLFCAVTTGALLRGFRLYDAAALAAGFVERVAAATPQATPFGVEFEPQLPWLWEQMELRGKTAFCCGVSE